MHRLSFLFLVVLGLLLHSCSGAEYYLYVDNAEGVDSTNCTTDPNGDTLTIRPNVSCKTISYALSTLGSSDFLSELQIRPGTYTGTSNTNLVLTFITAYISGYISSASTTRPVIDCEFKSSFVTVQSTAFTANYAFENIEIRNCVGNTGGAVNVAQSVTTTFTNCTFANNRATQSGGAIQGYGPGTLNIYSSIFKNNSAGTQGGAIAASSISYRMQGSTFQSNTASTGGAVYGNELGNAGSRFSFTNNTFVNNTASTTAGAFFAESKQGRTYSFASSIIDNNCASSAYTDSYDVQVRCASSEGTCSIEDKGTFSGCLNTYVPPTASDSGDEGGVSDRDRAIIIGVVVPFSIIAVVAIALFFYLRKRHNAEMGKRDDYRKKILKALDNMAPEDQEAARLEAQRAGPKAPKCQLCQERPIITPLPCGHEIVCSVCRTILLECPVKGCKAPTR